MQINLRQNIFLGFLFQTNEIKKKKIKKSIKKMLGIRQFEETHETLNRYRFQRFN